MNLDIPKRYAKVWGRNITEEKIAAFLPECYKVEGTATENGEPHVIIGGRDHHGWTLDKYVIPRLNSGLWAAQEIDLSHELMKQIPL